MDKKKGKGGKVSKKLNVEGARREKDLSEITEKILDKKVGELIHGGKGLKQLYTKRKGAWKTKTMLKIAKRLEITENYKEAINLYLKFIEEYLIQIKSRKYSLKDYYKLAGYYAKIAELYKKVHHIKTGDRKRDQKESARYHDRAAEIYSDNKEYVFAHRNYVESAATYKELKLYEKSAEEYVKLAEMYKRKKDKVLVSKFYDTAATYYLKIKNYEKTVGVILKSANLKKELGDEEGVGEEYKKIADIYRMTGNHLEAIKFYAMSVEILYGLEKFMELREVYNGVAQDYERIEEYDDAIYYYLSSAFLDKGRDDFAASNSFEGAARCYKRLGNYKLSIDYYNTVADLRINIGKYLDAAFAFKNIAECYKVMGDDENAAKYYFKYGEYGTVDKAGLQCIEGFQMSADIYLKIANSSPGSDKNRYMNVVGIYKKLAKSYSYLKEHEKAGDAYYSAAEIEAESLNTDSKETYIKAIAEYSKGRQRRGVAKSYRRMGDYEKAAQAYIRYADKQSVNGNLFYSGEGHREAGNCFKKLGDISKMMKSYNKGVKYYLQHLEKEGKRRITEDHKTNVGNTLKYIAESYRNMNRLERAEYYHKKALKYFEENKMVKDITFVKAFLNKIQAKTVMRSGDYAVADELLRDSIKAFKKILKDEEIDRDDKLLFKENIADIKKLLDVIAKKPEVSLRLDRRSYTFKDLPVIINMEIKNKGVVPIYRLSFLPHLPDEVKIHMEPQPIEKIEPNETVKNAIELISDVPGEYKLKPIEVIYRDETDETYVKGPNPISLYVVEKPSIDYKDHDYSISIYSEYAKTQLHNKNYFHAAEGYKGMAATYGRFGEGVKMEETYRAAIDTYTKFIGDMEKKSELSLAEHKWLSDTYRYVGECNEIINNFKEADKYFNKAIDAYRETLKTTRKFDDKILLKNRIGAIGGIISKIRAKIAVDQGDNKTALGLLDTSEKEINASIQKGGWTEEYEDYLDKTIREIDILRDDVEMKPLLKLQVKYPPETILDEEFTIKATIKNKWDKAIRNIKFLSKVPEDSFEVTKTPETILILKPGDSDEVGINVIPKKAGSFEFKSFDISYRDDKGNNFVSGSKYISLIALEETKGKKPGRVVEKKVKPDIALLLDRHSYTFRGLPVILNIEITNKSKNIPVYDVSFLGHLPDEIAIHMEPKPIAKIDSGETVRTTVELVSEFPGEYKLKPIELIYKDKADKKYVKAPNPIYLSVEDKPGIEYKDHDLTVNSYLEYAKTQLHNKNYFHAAEGYKGIAETYKRFGEAEKMEGSYRNAIGYYDRFIEFTGEKKEVSLAEHKWMSDAYRHIGECYEMINDLKESEGYLKKSIESYRKTMEATTKFDDKILIENQIFAINALLPKIKAKTAIDQGYYDKALALLTTSVNNFNEAIQKGGWSRDYEDYLDKNISEINALEKDIATKPQLTFSMNYPREVVKNKEFTLKVAIVNSWDSPVSDIGFLDKAPESFKVTKTPNTIPHLEVGDLQKAVIGLMPKEAGSFEFKVFDISCRDDKGNNFVGGSQYISLDVSEEKIGVKAGEGVIEGIRIGVYTGDVISSFVNESTALDVVVKNEGEVLIKDIDLLVNLPGDLEVEGTPSKIAELKPGESVKKQIKIKPLKPGRYSTIPLEVYYKDTLGNGHTKKSDIVNIEVGEEQILSEEQKEGIEKLRGEKKKIERMLSVSKSKYHKREIDGIAYRNLVQDYEKRLIEVEVELEGSMEGIGETAFGKETAGERKTLSEELKEEVGGTSGIGKIPPGKQHTVDLLATLDYPGEVSVNKPFFIDITLSNMTEGTIYNLSFLETITGELELKKPFEQLRILERGESVTLTAEFIPKKKASIGYSLFKIIYKDESGEEKIIDTGRVLINIT